MPWYKNQMYENNQIWWDVTEKSNDFEDGRGNGRLSSKDCNSLHMLGVYYVTFEKIDVIMDPQ